MKDKSINVKIFADGANVDLMRKLASDPLISGFTTNPTLMRKAGVADYKQFAKEVLRSVTDKPISFEVFSDDFEEMEAQAKEIASWAKNVYVKIPITNTLGETSLPVLERLCVAGVRVNVTAMTMVKQLSEVLPVLAKAQAAYASIFAGRIADCGMDPLPIIGQCLNLLAPYPQIELIWASPREVFNVVQAQAVGCHIITVTDDIFKKLPLLGKDLGSMSLDTVKMFHQDATAAGFSIKTKAIA
jgi:transaldolase